MLGRVAGWARPVSYTLGPEAGWRVAGWAGPEASRRHVRHASRRAEGLGLRLVSGYFETSLRLRRLLDDLGPDASRRSRPGPPGLSCLGSRTEAGARQTLA